MKDVSISCILRRAAALIAVCSVLIGAAVVMFTDIGTHALFRVGVRLNADEVDTADRAHLEYYGAKYELDSYSHFRIFIDGADPLSWEAALDFLKFIKQNRELNAVYIEGIDAATANEFLSSGNYELISDGAVSAEHERFLTALYSYNTLQPPQNRVYIAESHSEQDSFIIECGKYSRELKSDGIMDISAIYPGTEGCDRLFDVPSHSADGSLIRFGELDELEWYTNILKATSGNLGSPEFCGFDQPEYYFLIESGDSDGNQ